MIIIKERWKKKAKNMCNDHGRLAISAPFPESSLPESTESSSLSEGDSTVNFLTSISRNYLAARLLQSLKLYQKVSLQVINNSWWYSSLDLKGSTSSFAALEAYAPATHASSLAVEAWSLALLSTSSTDWAPLALVPVTFVSTSLRTFSTLVALPSASPRATHASARSFLLWLHASANRQ